MRTLQPQVKPPQNKSAVFFFVFFFPPTSFLISENFPDSISRVLWARTVISIFILLSCLKTWWGEEEEEEELP